MRIFWTATWKKDMWNEAVPKVADHNAWELPPFHKLPRIRGYWTAKWEEDMCNTHIGTGHVEAGTGHVERTGGMDMCNRTC